ncbi:methionyl-tRNA formyltransferase [Lichenicoccus sp.]|uniref:methionyl-tRNA formyltransferase n=1 Tax=Lichenicoccus sp. TaxID=2781899 RepID=UPI003D0DA4C3
MSTLQLAFMGTPDFAVPALRALREAGHRIAAVYTQPPRPAGRGKSVRRSAVHEEALRWGFEVRTPARLRADTEAQAAFAALDLDAAVIAAYGLLLPASMLAAPRRGCLNIHASLLPRWRGAAPIQAAILAGDTQSGVTIMQMEAGLDTGPMLRTGTVPITSSTTAQSLHDALAPLGARLILDVLANPPAPRAQPTDGVTYAPKLAREDGRLDWSEPAAAIDRRIRAMHPWPGAFTLLNGVALKLLAAEVASSGAAAAVFGTIVPRTIAPGTIAPGTILDDNLLVATGAGTLRITRLQMPGGKPLAATAFLRGHALPPGTRFG